jgi:Rieske Fe-S protein
MIDMPYAPRRALVCFPLMACMVGTAGCTVARREPDSQVFPGAAGSDHDTVPPAASPSPTKPLISLRQLRIGVPVVVPAGRAGVVVVRTGPTTVTAFSATCPHRGCTVEVLHGDLVCPCTIPASSRPQARASVG